MSDLDAQHALNHAWWEERAALHLDTPMYRAMVEELRAGGVALKGIEQRELGSVEGLRLLHLQCHVGLDTLSWARLGAEVTGVDYSAEALRRARGLAEELGIEARFVQSTIRDLRANLDGRFDRVVTSYGALIWLDELAEWARSIAHVLVPGGRFHVVDLHPMAFTIDQEAARDGETLKVSYPYFEDAGPMKWDEGGGSYADPSLETTNDVTMEWPHSLDQILSSILSAGLVIESFHEHREVCWEAFPCCVRDEDGLWRLPPALRDRVPLLFSLSARKPSPTEERMVPDAESAG